MAAPEIIFYFDSASSYSYIGFEFMERYKKLWGVKVDYRPFNLVQVMAKAKNTFSPYKLPFLFMDLKRTSAITKIPFRGTPKQYPYDPTTALRTLQYIKTRHPENLPEAMRKLWNLEYVQLIAPATPETVKQALEGVVDPSVVDAALASEDTLEAVVQNTEAVKQLKGFGAPTILVSKGDGSKPQFFFGSDRFEHIAIYLDKEFLSSKQLFAAPRI